jgi:hypothetical protein
MTDEAMLPDGTVVTIQQVRVMDTVPPLRCAGADDADIPCERPLRVRALTSKLKAAHFWGTHVDGCNRSSIRSEDHPGDRGHRVIQGPRASRWQLRLDAPAPTSGPNGRQRPDDTATGTATRRSTVDDRRVAANTAHVRALGSLLDAALTDRLPDEIALPGGPWTPTADLVCTVGAATVDRFTRGPLIVWGEVAAVRSTGLGGTMLLLRGAADRLAILIPKDMRDAFPLTQDREFIGRSVITIGARAGSPSRPYLKVASPYRIAFNPGVRVRALPAVGSTS